MSDLNLLFILGLAKVIKRAPMKSFVWHYYLSFLRIYIGFYTPRKKLLKDEKNALHEEPKSFNYRFLGNVYIYIFRIPRKILRIG